MKKILFRKLLSDCLSFFFITLFSASIIIWVFQAVNFLDIMIEDGRDYLVYINYSLLNFPKIVSRVLPFVFFFSFFYVITKYELNNELVPTSVLILKSLRNKKELNDVTAAQSFLFCDDFITKKI